MVNKMLRRMNPYRAMVTPVYMYPEGEEVTKVDRLKREGQYIYERNAKMNQRRVQDGGDVMRDHGDVHIGRRKRTRLVMRLRELENAKARQAMWMYEGEEEKEGE